MEAGDGVKVSVYPWLCNAALYLLYLETTPKQMKNGKARQNTVLNRTSREIKTYFKYFLKATRKWRDAEERSSDLSGWSPGLTDLRKCHKEFASWKWEIRLKRRKLDLFLAKVCAETKGHFLPQENHSDFNKKEEARPKEDSDRWGTLLGGTLFL